MNSESTSNKSTAQATAGPTCPTCGSGNKAERKIMPHPTEDAICFNDAWHSGADSAAAPEGDGETGAGDGIVEHEQGARCADCHGPLDIRHVVLGVCHNPKCVSVDIGKEIATQPEPALNEAEQVAQQAKRMDVLLDEHCIETIRSLTPSGGEEICFGGLMGGVRLLWRGSSKALNEAEERREFEKWALLEFYEGISEATAPARQEYGYEDDDVDDAWKGWLARGRAASGGTKV